MVDYIFADEIDGVIYFIFDEIEVVIDGLLQYSAFWFACMIQLILFNQILNLLFLQKQSLTYVIVILFDTGLATSQFFAGTAICGTKNADFISMLAFVHHL